MVKLLKKKKVEKKVEEKVEKKIEKVEDREKKKLSWSAELAAKINSLMRGK